MPSSLDASTDVFVGDPLCTSVDFRYTCRISGGAAAYSETTDPALLSRRAPFAVFLSTVFLENLDPRRRHDDYTVFGDTYLLDRLTGRLAQAVRDGRCKVIIDYSGEAAVADPLIFTAFHDALAARGFDPDNFGLVTSNWAFRAAYEAWAHQAGRSPLRVFSYNHFVYHFAGTISIAHKEDREKRRLLLQDMRRAGLSRRFVCLNNMPRTHRFFIVLYLIATGLQSETYLSCLHGPHADYLEATWAEMVDFDRERRIDRRQYDELVGSIPLLADVGVDHPRAKLAGLLGGLEIYGGSAASIVTESEFSRGEVLRFTEKLLKPMANFQPMIALSSPGSLQLLREEGFQTFEPYICEDYDEIIEPSARMQAVCREVDRLARLSADEVRIMLDELSPRLEHNYALVWDKARHGADLAIHDEIRAFVQG